MGFLQVCGCVFIVFVVCLFVVPAIRAAFGYNKESWNVTEEDHFDWLENQEKK